MKYGKKDQNHGEIRQAFDRLAWTYRDTSSMAGLGCDFIARHRDGYPVFLEVKRPGPPSARKLTESERQLQAAFGEFFRVVQSVEQALAAVGVGAL